MYMFNLTMVFFILNQTYAMLRDPRDTLLIRHFTGLVIYFSRFLDYKSYIIWK